MYVLLIAPLLCGHTDSPNKSLQKDMCGYHCMQVVAHLVETPDPSNFETALPAGQGPFSFSQIENAARQAGLLTSLLRWNSIDNARFPCPAILRVHKYVTSKEPDHFVVCAGEINDELIIIDFPRKPERVKRNHLREFWTGEVLYIDRPNSMAILGLRAQSLAPVFACTMIAFCGVLFCVSINRRRLSDLLKLRLRCVQLAMKTRKLRIATAVLFVLTASVSGFALSSHIKRPSVVVVPNEVSVIGDVGNRNAKVVDFAITNRGLQTVAVEKVETSCGCILVKSLQGQRISPGESISFQAHVQIPQAGNAAQSIRITHTGNSKPIEVQVELFGQQALPVVVRKVNASPCFPLLTAPFDAQKIYIDTYEQAGSKPWLTHLVCQSKNISITRSDLQELEIKKTNMIERKYVFTISWTNLPSETKEFREKIYLPPTGRGERDALLGVLTAYAAR